MIPVEHHRSPPVEAGRLQHVQGWSGPTHPESGREWADRGARVNCMLPGINQTPLLDTPALRPPVSEWVTGIPAGRLGDGSDLPGGAVYLASEVSDSMTAHNLVIEGGQTL